MPDGRTRAGDRDGAVEPNWAALGLVGRSRLLEETLKVLTRFAAADAVVLITGESGTGKTLAARVLHYLGPRRARPFIAVNCGALPEALFENEVFGHERGAYTHAQASQAGLIRQAEGGTLFLDEVDALGARAQAALLRFVESGEYRPLGAGRLAKADVRVVAATNADLAAEAAHGRFRADLLWRLGILGVRMPALRERPEDIGDFADHVLDRLADRLGPPRRRLAPACRAWLARQPWQGNFRELEGWLLRRWLLEEGAEIGAEAAAVPDRACAAAEPCAGACLPALRAAKAEAVARFERAYLEALLGRHGGNLSGASREAGTERTALRRLLAKHGLTAAAFRAGARA